MSDKKSIPYERALKVAIRLRDDLAASCDRIEIAGSLRRLNEYVRDVDMVAIPTRDIDLLGQETEEFSMLECAIGTMTKEALLGRALKCGSRHRQYFLPHLGANLELYLVRPETWAVQFAIRTGPAEFSRLLVTQRFKGGYLPDRWRVEDGLVYDEENDVVPFETEEELLLRLVGQAIEPQQRGTVASWGQRA